MDQRIDLALRQHVLDRLVVGQARDLEPGRRREVHILVELGDPFDGFVRHAVFMLEDAAHPVDRRHEEGLDADLLAYQVVRRLDALAGVDEHEAVAEAPMQEHRNGRDRHAAVTCHDVGRAGSFGHVEMALAQEAPVAGGRVHIRQDREVDAVRRDGSVQERRTIS